MLVSSVSSSARGIFDVVVEEVAVKLDYLWPLRHYANPPNRRVVSCNHRTQSFRIQVACLIDQVVKVGREHHIKDVCGKKIGEIEIAPTGMGLFDATLPTKMRR